MRVLYLFNSIITGTLADIERGNKHDSHLFGMLRLRARGIHTDYLELEQFLPRSVTAFLRRHILTMHYAHLPLFPLFFRYDVVFTSTAYSALIVKALLHIKSFKWVVLDFNILGTLGEEKTFRQKLLAWAIGKADGIIAISQAEAEALKVRFPHLKEHIVFFHEATDTKYFKPSETDREGDVVLSVGNYGRDFTTLITATEGLDVECRLATKLISRGNAQKLPAHVTVNLYDHEGMKNNYVEAKVVFVGIDKPDTYYDSVGTFAVIEALSAGKAVIVTDTKNMHSYIEHNVNGVLVPHHDSEALRREIQRLLSETATRTSIAGEARRRAVEWLDADVFTQKLATYLGTLTKTSTS